MVSYKAIWQLTTENQVWLRHVGQGLGIRCHQFDTMFLVRRPWGWWLFAFVHGGWANEFFDDGKAELGACLPSRPSACVHLSIGQGQPEPKDNFLIWRSQPVYSGSLGQQAERQLSVPSDCCRRGAVFLVLLFLCVTASKQSVLRLGARQTNQITSMSLCHLDFSSHSLCFGMIGATTQCFWFLWKH